MKTQILCSIIYFLPPENRAVHEIMWENNVQPGRPHMTIWRRRIARWIPKATNTHLGYVILIAFPLQQWFHRRVSMLRYAHISCLVTNLNVTLCAHFLSCYKSQCYAMRTFPVLL